MPGLFSFVSRDGESILFDRQISRNITNPSITTYCQNPLPFSASTERHSKGGEREMTLSPLKLRRGMHRCKFIRETDGNNASTLPLSLSIPPSPPVPLSLSQSLSVPLRSPQSPSAPLSHPPPLFTPLPAPLSVPLPLPPPPPPGGKVTVLRYVSGCVMVMMRRGRHCHSHQYLRHNPMAK